MTRPLTIDPLAWRASISSFDVGAHAGWVSQKYRRLFPQGTIHAFEPTPVAAARLRETLASDDRLHVHALALSDRQGAMRFHVNSFPLVDFYDIWKSGPVLLQFAALFALPKCVRRIMPLS